MFKVHNRKTRTRCKICSKLTIKKPERCFDNLTLSIIDRKYPAGNYMFKVNNRKTRTRCEICSKLTIKTSERCWRRSGVFIVIFEHISHLVPVFLLLTSNK